LPELVLSGSDDEVLFPLPRSPEERLYELSPGLDASACAQSYSPGFVSWSGDEDVATSLLGLLGDGDEDESGYKMDAPNGTAAASQPPTGEFFDTVPPPEASHDAGFAIAYAQLESGRSDNIWELHPINPVLESSKLPKLLHPRYYDESGFKPDALVAAQPSSPELAPPTSDSAAASPSPILLEVLEESQDRSGASAVT
jgi:hypothetical protein